MFVKNQLLCVYWMYKKGFSVLFFFQFLISFTDAHCLLVFILAEESERKCGEERKRKNRGQSIQLEMK